MATEKAIPSRKLWRAGWLAAALATGVNLAIFFIGKLAFEVPFIIPMGGPSGPLMSMPFIIVVVFSIAAALGATALLILLRKYTSHPLRNFLILSGVVFLISFMIPIGLPDTVASSTRLSLILMHFPTAAIIVGLLSRVRSQ